MNDNLNEQLLLLPEYFQGHLILTLSAMAVGTLISVPLGIWAAQSKRVRTPLLIVVSIIQTIPSLAILALIVALIGGRIGFLPAFIALTLYCMLPIVRNTVSGLETVQWEIIEAAKGIGMTPRQILVNVELPLALPVVIAGIRTAMVWTVGLATLSTLVGATSFGNYIFIGIQTRNLVAVTVGSLAAATMAIALDGIIGAMQWLAEQRLTTAQSQKTRFVKGTVIISVIALGIVSALTLIPKPRPDFVIAGKPFTEQYIMAGLMAAELQAQGFTVEQRLGLGSAVVYDAVQGGSVDLYLEYTGTVWATQMNQTANPGRLEVLEAVNNYINQQSSMVSFGVAGFQNRYALAMRRDRAEELGIESIEDLIPIADSLSCGADLEFFGRLEWRSLRDTYNIDFDRKLTFDASLMYTAVNDRQVDLITAYTTDGRVDAFDLKILEDPRNALLPYDGIFIASARAAQNPEFVSTVTTLVGKIPDQLMREANRLVDVDGLSVAEAVDYLRSQIAAP